MKIMEIVSGPTLNGAIYHCLLLSRELARRGHQVTLVCRPGAWIADQVGSTPIEVVHSDMHRWPADELKRIGQILNAGNFDVVHTHMSRAHLFGVLLRFFSSVPRVATAHCRHLQLHWALNDMVIAPSESTRCFHRRVNFVPAHRIVTVHNFVDSEPFDSLRPNTRQDVRASLDIGDSASMITMVGNVMERKGQIYAVRAFPRILSKAPDTEMVFVGNVEQEYDYHQQVCREADQLGVSSHLHWLGLRKDVPRLLAASDLFLLASLEETLPLAILEAMAVGLPTVATNVGGIPECVAHGRTGLLVPRRDHTAMAEAVSELLTDAEQGRRMGQAARRRYRRKFSTASQTSAIEAVFEQVAGTRLMARAA